MVQSTTGIEVTQRCHSYSQGWAYLGSPDTAFHAEAPYTAGWREGSGAASRCCPGEEASATRRRRRCRGVEAPAVEGGRQCGARTTAVRP